MLLESPRSVCRSYRALHETCFSPIIPTFIVKYSLYVQQRWAGTDAFDRELSNTGTEPSPWASRASGIKPYLVGYSERWPWTSRVPGGHERLQGEKETLLNNPTHPVNASLCHCHTQPSSLNTPKKNFGHCSTMFSSIT